MTVGAGRIWIFSKSGKSILKHFFPKAKCSLYNTYIELLEADSVSIVFSSYYTNSPGSASGHTLFRIAKKKSPNKAQNSELLDHGIGYAANVGDTGPLRYMLHGVFGGFSGSFTNFHGSVSAKYLFPIRAKFIASA